MLTGQVANQPLSSAGGLAGRGGGGGREPQESAWAEQEVPWRQCSAVSWRTAGSAGESLPPIASGDEPLRPRPQQAQLVHVHEVIEGEESLVGRVGQLVGGLEFSPR